jgi:hypothetical protein
MQKAMRGGFRIAKMVVGQGQVCTWNRNPHKLIVFQARKFVFIDRDGNSGRGGELFWNGKLYKWMVGVPPRS